MVDSIKGVFEGRWFQLRSEECKAQQTRGEKKDNNASRHAIIRSLPSKFLSGRLGFLGNMHRKIGISLIFLLNNFIFLSI